MLKNDLGPSQKVFNMVIANNGNYLIMEEMQAKAVIKSYVVTRSYLSL